MKLKTLTLFGSAALIAASGFLSCKKSSPTNTNEVLNQPPNLPEQPFDYEKKHHVNNNLATLGRVLFYDKNLSLNNSTSCGSCHKQEFAFADNVRFNAGFNGIALTRNSPSIQNIRGFIDQTQHNVFAGQLHIDDRLPFSPTKDNQQPVSLFWDARQTNVADMVLNPVLNHKEMNMPDFEVLVKKLGSTSYYPPLFEKAYGNQGITKEKIAFAMQSFLACLNTQNFLPPDPNKVMEDQKKQQEVKPLFGTVFPGSFSLTPEERMGQFLFHSKYNCAQCHDPQHNGGYGGGPANTDPLMFDVGGTKQGFFAPMPAEPVINPGMFNIGLDETPRDKGRGAITGLPGDEGLFKIPTLKNIAVTAPYMHDGRYATLEQVIDHYSHNIRNNRNLASQFKNLDGSVKVLNISAPEKMALVAFLKTLKDPDFLTSPMYSDPFK